MRSTSKAIRRTGALLVASATVMLAAACGGGGGATSGGAAPATPGNGGGGQAFAAYIQCMKQNGVTLAVPSFGPRAGASRGPGERSFPSGMPRPNFSGGPRGGGFGGRFMQKPADVDEATWQKAQAACASLRPSGRPGGGGPGANSAYRNCLQQHGVTFGGGMNTADPNVQKALQTCRVLRPTAIPSAPA